MTPSKEKTMPEEVSKEALLPCPFCGGRDLRPCGNGDGGQWLTCDSCSADGPYAHSDEEQNRLWNTRSPSALSVGEEDVERVARAISIKRHELLRLNPPYWSDGEWDGVSIVLTPNERDRYIEEARAALAVLPSNKSWNEAVEECAKVAENHDAWPLEGADIAKSIRSLVREGEG